MLFALQLLTILYCKLSQMQTDSHACKVNQWQHLFPQRDGCTSLEPPTVAVPMEAGISWLAFWQACSLRGEKKIKPRFCAFVHRCEVLHCVQKSRVRERESCGIATNRHLKSSVESKIPCMVIAVRDGIFNVWQMYQHTVRKYLLLEEKHFVGYIFPSVALVDLRVCTLS